MTRPVRDNHAVDFISYEQFGVRFVSHAVTPERVASFIGNTAGDEFEMGPMSAGPGGIAGVKAVGRIGAAEVARSPDDLLKFVATLPIDLELEVKLAGARHRYRGDVRVPLRLTVRTAEPLMLVIEVGPVAPADVDLQLRAAGAAAGMLQRMGDMDSEVRKQVARAVNERVSSDRARKGREIDIRALISKTEL